MTDRTRVVSTGELLEGWMKDNRVNARVLADVCGRGPFFVADILAGKPLDEQGCAALARATMVPAIFWRTIEHNYRAGLTEQQKTRCHFCLERPWEILVLLEKDHDERVGMCNECAKEIGPQVYRESHEQWTAEAVVRRVKEEQLVPA